MKPFGVEGLTSPPGDYVWAATESLMKTMTNYSLEFGVVLRAVRPLSAGLAG